MNQDFDQLFRDKLQNHEAQPSAEAWAKMRGKLPKKDRKPFWFVAFGVLLCGMGVAYWYFGNKLTEIPNLEQKANVFEQKMEKVEKNTKPEATKNTNNSSVLERKTAKQVLKVETKVKLEKTPETKTVLEEKIETKSETKLETKLENQTEKTEEKPIETKPEAEPEMPITVQIKRGDEASNRQEPLHEKDSLVKRKPRFFRILKQLHNFKEGEKVNFQDLKRDKE